ncbi:MAG: DedD protein [Kangiellaceae bacterium]|jgi:DedD protein
MTSALQNRLVGTIIVVALVVILVPEFLDGEKRTNKQEFIDVPSVAELVKVQNIEAFDTSEVASQLNQPVEVIDELPVDEPAFSQTGIQANAENLAKDNKSTANTKKPTGISVRQNSAKQTNELLDLDIKDSGWVVQLGSFKHQKNVRELLKTLTNAGYRAYSRPVMTSVGELTKVFVGPELDKEKLERALPHLQEITNLKGKITAFEVSAG